MNSDAFGQLVTDGEGDLSGWDWLPPCTLIAVAVLVLLGVQPRLAEYRG